MRPTPSPFGRRLRGASLAAAFVLAPLFGSLTARAESLECPALAPFLLSGAPFRLHAPHTRRRLSILAIGSSSTEGVAASSPSQAYPAQLVEELAHSYGIKVEAVNGGVGGETADQTVARLEATLAATAPDLVLWQVGTNDALRGMDETRFRAIVREGIDAAAARQAPLILIDPQVPPSRAHDATYARYARIIEDEAAARHVPVVSRFQMMEKLAVSDPQAWRSLLSPDGVHMNDLGYACLARSLAGPIADGLARGGGAAL